MTAFLTLHMISDAEEALRSFTNSHLESLKWLGAVGLVVILSSLLSWALRSRERVVARIGGHSFTRWDLCRGVLITGDTGSGKTKSGVNRLLVELFRREPGWGGICINDKPNFHETLLAMARHFGREKDLVILRPGVGGLPPLHRFNPVSNASIPWLTYGKIVVDTAISQGQNRDQSFFRHQAQHLIAKALESLSVAGFDVTLENACQLLTNAADLDKCLGRLDAVASEPAQLLAELFREQFINAPPEQRGGVVGTVANYLSSYATAGVTGLINRDSTFSLSDIDKGKIICLSMPNELATERRYIATFLKQLFYLHVLSRFDRPAAESAKLNLLILCADEAQRFVTDSEDGLSDFNVIDRVREANAAVIMATQSTLSFVPPLGRDKAKVLALNLRNRIIFKAADEEDAVSSADFIGKRKHRKVTRNFGKNGSSTSTTEDEEHRFKPSVLRQLRQHEALVVHCERGARRRLLPPLEADGSVSSWFNYPWWRVGR